MLDVYVPSQRTSEEDCEMREGLVVVICFRNKLLEV